MGKISLEEVKAFAFEQMSLPMPIVEVLGKPSTAVVNPWLDRRGQCRMSTEEAKQYWGKETFDEFVGLAEKHLREKKAEEARAERLERRRKKVS